MRRNATRLLLAVPLLIAAGVGLRAAGAGAFTSACPAAGPIKIDGRLDEPAWGLTIVAADMRVLGTNRAARVTTSFRFLYSADALLLGVECQVPAAARRLKQKPTAKEHDDSVFGDESFELYLQPVDPGPYYHFAANFAGVRYEGRGFDKSWNGQWQVRTTKHDTGWQAEARIPFKTLGLERPPKPGETLRFNVARNDRVYQQYHSWAELTRGFHEPGGFGTLRFVGVSVGAGPLRLLREGQDLVVETETRAGAAAVGSVTAHVTVRCPAGQFDLRPTCKLGPKQSAVLTDVAKAAWAPGASVWLSPAFDVGEQRLYSPSPLTMPTGLVRPRRPSAPALVTIQNADVALTFDKTTGRLLSARNKQSGLSAEFGKTGTPVIEIDAVRYPKNPRFFRDDEVETVVPDYETLVSLGKRDTAEGQTLDVEHRIGGYMPLKLSITVPRRGVETVWRMELDNKLTYSPTQSFVVHRVRYPSLSDVEENACGSAAHVILPTLMGQKFPEPGKNLGRLRPASYIGAATMGWFDFYGDKGGLYFKVGDIEPLPQTDLVAQSDPKTRRLRLAIQRWALCWPGEKWTPGPCSLGVHAGDWHAAADLYRAWFRQTFRQYPRPQWLTDADGYVMSGGPSYEFADFPRAIENAKAIGIRYIELWSEMTGGDMSYHAFGLPNPYMGTEEELTKAIADLHAKGGHIGFYLNFNTGDPLLGTFVRQPRLAQKIPKDIPRPALDYIKDNWIQQSIMNHAGSYSTWNCVVPGYLDGYWNACPGSKKWTDFYYYWVVEKWAKQYKADVWYLDSCPVSRGCPCFAFDHGHERPMPEGQAIINFYKRLRAGAPKDFCIMQEYSSDRLLPYSTHALGLMWHPAFAHPEVVRYTLPEYPLFSGMCNGIKGLKHFYPGEKFNYVDAVERVFLIGNRYEFSMSNRPPEMASEWQRKLVSLRRACHAEMNYGDFLDDIGLGPLPERVYARLFRRADRGRLVVTLLDRRKGMRTPLKVSVDLKAVGVGAAKRVDLVTLDGRRPLAVPTLGQGRAVVTVPAYEGRPAALLIEVSKGKRE